MRRLFIVLPVALGACLAIANSKGLGPACAETLEEALTSAYTTNPTLDAQRANQRATAEGVPQALSGWRPTAQVNGSGGVSWATRNFGSAGGGTTSQTLKPTTGELVIDQPLYRGGRTVASTRQAEATVAAGNQVLRSTEQQVLLQGIQAYLDVLLAQSVVQLNQNNVQVLRRQLQATRDRFEVGEITRTDVAQSSARLSLGIANLIGAQGNQANVGATYERVIGHPPADLKPVPIVPVLPSNLDAAYAQALRNNPDLLSSELTEESSRWAVRVARGQLLPTVDLQGSVSHAQDQTYSDDRYNTASVSGQLRIPLYEAGLAASQVRQSLQQNNRDRLQIADARRSVVEQVATAWENLRAARAGIQSFREQVRANIIALEGVSQEAQVGSRTVLDVLDAEQELLNSRVNLVQSERNEYLAAYQLLSALGRLNPATLGLAVKPYDPGNYYQKVRNKWFDPSVYDFDWFGVDTNGGGGSPPATVTPISGSATPAGGDKAGR